MAELQRAMAARANANNGGITAATHIADTADGLTTRQVITRPRPVNESFQRQSDASYGYTGDRADRGPAVVCRVVSGRPRVGKNDPCPCGSGKKFKKCCHGQ